MRKKLSVWEQWKKEEQPIMNNNRQLFEEAPVAKAVAVMAIPPMISMLVGGFYNMAGTIFFF